MKKLIFAGVVLVAFLALATAETTVDTISSNYPQLFKSGIYIGTGTSANTKNKITRSLGTSVVYDFAAMDAGSCLVTTTALSGALTNDVCVVSPGPENVQGIQADCWVSAADVVTIQACSNGLNPADGGWNVRVTSSQ